VIPKRVVLQRLEVLRTAGSRDLRKSTGFWIVKSGKRDLRANSSGWQQGRACPAICESRAAIRSWSGRRDGGGNAGVPASEAAPEVAESAYADCGIRSRSGRNGADGSLETSAKAIALPALCLANRRLAEPQARVERAAGVARLSQTSG